MLDNIPKILMYFFLLNSIGHSIGLKRVNMSRGMRFPTIWYVRPAKAQTILPVRAVWSEPLLVSWVLFDS